MKAYIPGFICGLLIAVVWGYFSDLQNGQVGWFIGRLVFVSIALVVVLRVIATRASAKAGACVLSENPDPTVLAANKSGLQGPRLAPTDPKKS